MPSAASPPALSECPLFAGLASGLVEELEQRGLRRRFAVGDCVLREGEPAEHLFVLLRGVVRVLLSDNEGQEVTVKLFSAPAVFGEMETLTRTPFIETVEVLRAAEVVTFDYPTLDRILRDHAEVTRRLLVDVCERFRTSGVNQGFIAFENVERRLANLLLSYARALGTPVQGGTQIVAEGVTHDSLARGIAATRKSVQRVFNAWKEQDLISRRERYYVVHDMNRLAELSGEEAPHYDHRMNP